MTAKQRLKKARECLDEGRNRQAARHIASARRKQKSLTKDEIAEALGTSKGWVRDFLGQRRYATVEPFPDPKRKTKTDKARSEAAKKAARTRKRKAAERSARAKKAAQARKRSKSQSKPARKKSSAEKAVTKTVKATFDKVTPSKPSRPSSASRSRSASKSGQKKS